MKLYHFDLYRLEDADALYEMGLEEYIPPEDGAAMIEWPQMAQEAMPADALAIELRYAGEGRTVTLEPMGRFDEGRVEDILRTMEACDEHPCD